MWACILVDFCVLACILLDVGKLACILVDFGVLACIFVDFGVSACIQTLRAFRRAGKVAKRKVVSVGHGAKVEGKGSMRAEVEGLCKEARVT